MRIMPYRTVDNFIKGAVLTFTNITAYKDMEQSLEACNLYAAGIIDLVKEPLVVLNHLLRVEMATEAFIKSFKLIPEQIKGQWLFHLGNGQWNIPGLHEAMDQVLLEKTDLTDYILTHEFPVLGPVRMRLNTRRIAYQDNKTFKVLLAIEVM